MGWSSNQPNIRISPALAAEGDISIVMDINGTIYTEKDATGYPQFPVADVAGNELTTLFWNMAKGAFSVQIGDYGNGQVQESHFFSSELL